MKLSILVVQNNAIIGNKNATIENIDMLLSKYRNKKFDLIVLPEVFSIGWNCSKFYESAENTTDSISLNFLKQIAMEFNSIVFGGSIIFKDNASKLTNTCAIISPKGEVITTYDKMHLFSHKGAEENKFIKSGEELKLLKYGDTRIATSICYDIRFPELYRCYSKNGAEILINMAAWSKTKPEHWEIMHKSRAIENQCYMIVANQTGKISSTEYNLGHSMVINPWGEIIAELHEEEGCLEVNIDTNTVKELRKNFPLLNDRRDKDFNNFNCKEIEINA